MQLIVEKHVIKLGHDWFEYWQEITNSSRQLFNSAQYVQRQGFFYGHGTQTQAALDKMFQQHEAYKLMPSKVSQLVLKQSADSWKAYLAALKAYEIDPSVLLQPDDVHRYSYLKSPVAPLL
jgi:hypothetical protein